MAISGECDSCGRKVQAPDSMAGKSVRCKQCGTIFRLPGGDVDETPMAGDLSALAEIERSFESHDAPPPPRRRPADQAATPDTGGEDDENEPYDFAGPVYAGRTNVFYRFPYAREVDQYLPYVLVFGGIAWVAAVCFKLAEIEVTWLAIVRTLIAVVGYSLFIAPITLMLIRTAGRKMRFQMPSNDRWRAFAAYFPGFAIAFMLWTLGHGELIALLLGCLAGITIATGAMALLFRLYPLEIAPTGIYGGIGFLIGVGITAGIFFAINALLISIAMSTKNPDMLPGSLFGPQMAWVSQEDRERIHAELNPPKPKPVEQPATMEVAVAPPKPQGTGSPVVPVYTNAPIPAGFNEVLTPLVESKFIAALRTTESIAIEPWDTTTWKSTASAKFTKSGNVGDRYVLSPDGNMVARIASFPRLSVQIWNFKEARISRVINLDDTVQSPELVGFLSNEQLLVRGNQGSGSVLQVLDVPGTKSVYILSTPRFDPGKTTLAVSRDGTLAAITARADNMPTLVVYNLVTSQPVATQKIDALDPSFAVKPTGINFSFDGTQLAMLFEQQGNGLILNYRIDREKNTVEKTAEHVYPAGPLPDRDASTRPFSDAGGNALAWLPNNRAWLIYGQGVFSAERGQMVADLLIPNVLNCSVRLPNIVEANIGPASSRQVGVATLDMEKINELLAAPPAN